ncbi:tetratricopeptide repeat protein [Helicobacter ibis]|uniref:Tetratricopeptide repeat protein n=1 Tax=Helicobacter ibis TaxID=2962633 RepID=A0ABT4VDK0_9HELI|nr:tetratricopeptide repeat protein [Helicobacter ibis]MDA3968780.1 tetratricopeptide repeat protein [Helicobacter ibis]
MEFQYRDPLFSIVILIFCIGVISILAYYWNYITSKQKQNGILKFMKNFDYVGFDNEIKEFLALSPNPMPSILFMAKMYSKSANYEKAIRLYLTLLNNIKNPIDKVPILESLSDVYYKAGFPLRSKEICLEILKHFPRDEEALRKLIKINEELSLYQEALEALKCLKEIKGNMTKEELYLQAKILITSKESNKEKKLLEILKKEKNLSRIILSFFKDFYPTLFWQRVEELENKDILNILDILWNTQMQELPSNPLKSKILNDIYKTKGYYDDDNFKKETFELESICLLQREGHYFGDLKFSYKCNICNAISPLSFDRCPHCGEILSIKCIATLKEKENEMRYSFL